MSVQPGDKFEACEAIDGLEGVRHVGSDVVLLYLAFSKADAEYLADLLNREAARLYVESIP